MTDNERKKKIIIVIAIVIIAIVFCVSGVLIISNVKQERLSRETGADAGLIESAGTLLSNNADSSQRSVSDRNDSVSVSERLNNSSNSNQQEILITKPTLQITNAFSDRTRDGRSNVNYVIEFYQQNDTNTWIQERLTNRNTETSEDDVVGGDGDVLYRRIEYDTN